LGWKNFHVISPRNTPTAACSSSQSFIARLESGQRRVDVAESLELAEALGFDPGTVLAAVRTAA
jgi:hypothetical protein